MEVAQSNLNGGKLLAELRRHYGLTQAELAKRAAVSRSMVAQLEIGERRPSQKLLRTLCSAMNAVADDERQLMLAYEFRPTGETPEQIAAFLRADKNLTSEQAERIAGLVREAYETYKSEAADE
jgi:transcriptional regulator with XRE-family HTH domain